MQLHRAHDVKPNPIKIEFRSSFEQKHKGTTHIVFSPKFLKALEGESDQVQQPPQLEQVQIAVTYLKKSKQLLNDFNSDGTAVLYTYEQSDTFQKAVLHVMNDARKLGCQIARQSRGKKNYVSIIFENDITNEQINNFVFAFQLASYKWDLKSKKINTKDEIIQQTEDHLQIVHSQNFEEGLKLVVENDWKQRIHLVMQRANVATTQYMIDHIDNIQKDLGDKINVVKIVADQLLDQNLNLIHAVGRTGKYPPALVSLSYKGASDDKAPFVAFIGKGVIFDCGGLSIKSTSGMENMYDDKTGACTVLEAFHAIVKLNIPINLVCTVALVENSIGTDAYRVSDIIKSYKGLTVEILNTDAEGRLILADAMSYTQNNFNVAEMIELSTLTGACGSAIGSNLAGLFTNFKKFLKLMEKLSEHSEEQFWPLPLNDDMRNQMKGHYADLNNAGGKVGASCAAAFLENFVEKGVKWMHWDIASVSLKASDSYIYNKGASGFGLQQLVYYAAAKAGLIGEGAYEKYFNKKEKQQKLN